MKKTFGHLAVIAIVASVLLVPSCRSPLGESGSSATVTLAIGGVVPPSRAAEAAAFGAGSRILAPSTASVRVTMSWDGGTLVRTVPVFDGQASVPSVPIGIAVALYIETLDDAGNVLTVGSIPSREYVAGVQDLTEPVKLTPPVSVTLSDRTLTATGAIETFDLDYGEIAYYTIAFQGGMTSEYQIVYDTGKARWAWMSIYDEDWNPVTPVASDREQGWVVVDASATSTLRVAVGNCVPSPGYPAGTLTGSLDVRAAIFWSAGGTGAGTSGDPAAFGSTIEDGQSLFFQAGSYTPGSRLSLSSADIMLYGGFSPGDWNDRSGTTSIQSSSTSDTSSVYLDAFTGVLDGFTIAAPASIVSQVVVHGLSVAPTDLVISNCVVKGNEYIGELNARATGAVSITGGTCEVASCRLEAGALGGGNNNDEYFLRGIYAQLSSVASSLYVHDSVIDGGHFAGERYEGHTSAIDVSDCTRGSVVVAGCELWGGVEKAASTSLPIITSGIYGVGGTLDALLVANTRIGAGYILDDITGYKTAYGVLGCELVSSGGRFVVAGCTIDSGYAYSSTGIAGCFGYGIGMHVGSTNTAPVASALSNAFFGSGYGAGNLQYASLNIENTYRAWSDVAGNAAFSERASQIGTLYADDYASTLVVAGGGFSGNVSSASRPIASELVGYSLPATFEDFLAQSWRPASGATMVGKPGADVMGGGYITAADLASWPALGLDLAGKPRPSSGAWARGAYE